MGDRHDVHNVFRYSKVVENLPGMAKYDPTKPWVYKARDDGVIAADVVIYVDDLRPSGPTEVDCWMAAQRISAGLAQLGMQDAARKRRISSQEPGAWIGAIICTNNGEVRISVLQDRWDKAREIVDRLHQLSLKGTKFNYKQLERDRGFLIYIGMTFPVLKAYLKGLHATLAAHNGGRDEDGWKIVNHQGEQLVVCLGEDDAEDVPAGPARPGPPPTEVWGVRRLKTDLEALSQITSSEHPPKRLARAKHKVKVVYGFGDALGRGLGAAVEVQGKIWWHSGMWDATLEKESSNFRELLNLVIALEDAANKGVLEGAEVFMFTDNIVAERAFFRGTSSSRFLFELVLRLKLLESKGDCILHLIHVAGTRMIESGVDGLSRGDQTSGVMRGVSVRDFVPIHRSAVVRQPQLATWIGTWALSRDKKPGKLLEPVEWESALIHGTTYIWVPAPAAADAAAEAMASCIHMNSQTCHVFVVPRLMTAWWNRKIRKATDVHLTIPVSSPIWPRGEHEPLTVSICLPLSRRKPWRHKETRGVEQLGRSLSGMWKTQPERTGSVLREFLLRAWRDAAV